jgi:hypothetical protein
VLGEWSPLRVGKLGLGGLEMPFVCTLFDTADIYLNAFRGVLTDERVLWRRYKFGWDVLSDRKNCGKPKSSKGE